MKQEASNRTGTIFTAPDNQDALIVEYEQAGKERAAYGEQLLQRLSSDLSEQFGRGFSVDNLESIRLFYLAYPEIGCKEEIRDTVSVFSI